MIGEPRLPRPDGHGAESSVTMAAPVQDQAGTTPAVSSDLIEAGQLRQVVEGIGSIVAQTTLMGTLLYYFGFNFTDAVARFYGIDANTLGYSTHEYIVRSVVPVAPAFGALLLIGLVLMGIHGQLKGWMDSRRHLLLLERLAWALIVVGTIALVSGVVVILGIFDQHAPWLAKWARDHRMMLPLSVLIGVVCAAYGTQVRRVWLFSGSSQARLQNEPRWLRLVRLALLFVLIGVNVFWAAGEFATDRGWEYAEELAERLPRESEAILHSKASLGIDPGGGISVHQVEGAEDGYRFRYDGMRYLTRSAGKFFLLSPCWKHDLGRTIILTDDDSVRVELRQADLPPKCR